MKKLTAWLGVLAVMFLAGEVMAASSLIVRVQPTGTKGLTLSSALVDYTTKALGSNDNIYATAIVVTSTGTFPQTYGMRLTGTGAWTAGAAAAADVFNLRAVFNTTLPVVADFAANDDLATGASVPSTALVFGKDVGGAGSGLNVAPGAARNLWFKLNMPTTSLSVASQDITVEIAAQ